MDDLIRRQDVLALSKDVTLKNGAKHRCVDTTDDGTARYGRKGKKNETNRTY